MDCKGKSKLKLAFAFTINETIKTFAENHNAILTAMQNSDHWFHTKEQMRFLDEWILKN